MMVVNIMLYFHTTWALLMIITVGTSTATCDELLIKRPVIVRLVEGRTAVFEWEVRYELSDFERISWTIDRHGEVLDIVPSSGVVIHKPGHPRVKGWCSGKRLGFNLTSVTEADTDRRYVLELGLSKSSVTCEDEAFISIYKKTTLLYLDKVSDIVTGMYNVTCRAQSTSVPAKYRLPVTYTWDVSGLLDTEFMVSGRYNETLSLYSPDTTQEHVVGVTCFAIEQGSSLKSSSETFISITGTKSHEKDTGQGHLVDDNVTSGCLDCTTENNIDRRRQDAEANLGLVVIVSSVCGAFILLAVIVNVIVCFIRNKNKHKQHTIYRRTSSIRSKAGRASGIYEEPPLVSKLRGKKFKFKARRMSREVPPLPVVPGEDTARAEMENSGLKAPKEHTYLQLIASEEANEPQLDDTDGIMKSSDQREPRCNTPITGEVNFTHARGESTCEYLTTARSGSTDENLATACSVTACSASTDECLTNALSGNYEEHLTTSRGRLVHESLAKACGGPADEYLTTSRRRSVDESLTTARCGPSNKYLTTSRRRSVDESLTTARNGPSDEYITTTRRRPADEYLTTTRAQSAQELIANALSGKSDEYLTTSRGRLVHESLAKACGGPADEYLTTSRCNIVEESLAAARCSPADEYLTTTRRRPADEYLTTTHAQSAKEYDKPGYSGPPNDRIGTAPWVPSDEYRRTVCPGLADEYLTTTCKRSPDEALMSSGDSTDQDHVHLTSAGKCSDRE